MTDICTHRIEHPSAWTSVAIGGKDGLTYRLKVEEVAALDELVQRNREGATTEITRSDFDHPVINAMMATARDWIMDGRGSIILAHPEIDRYSLQDYERLYWGLGTHLGQGVGQSRLGDKIGYVQKDENNPTGRGYLGDQELRPHTDFHEILSLASWTKAADGGESGLVSSIALHNEMLATRPDLLPMLYEGFYHGYNVKAGTVGQRISPYKVPIYCYVDGKVSCYYHTIFMRFASEILGEAFPAPLQKAMAHLNKLAVRPDIQARFMLEPGEMLFWHNWMNFHSRTAFQNSPTLKRLLLRLWLNVENGRPVVPEIAERARLIDRDHQELKAA